MKAQTFHSLLTGVLCLALATLAASAYNQHQQLTVLTATLHAQPDPAAALREQRSEVRSTLTAVQQQLDHLEHAQATHTAAQTSTEQAMQQVHAQVDGLTVRLDHMPDETFWAGLETRLGPLESSVATLQAAQRSVPERSDSRTPVAAKKLSAPPSPPFSILGVERRGETRLVAVLPTGHHSLSAVQLLAPGEQTLGWQLRTLRAGQAVFEVAGYSDQTLSLP